MKRYPLTYTCYGERAILIQWPSKIEEAILNDVLTFKAKIVGMEDPDIIQTNHSYNSILILYQHRVQQVYKQKTPSLNRLYHTAPHLTTQRKMVRMWKIPVCYDLSFSPDMRLLCAKKKISAEEVIHRHTRSTYIVYFIGFLPGFIYLGGLENSLYFPRKKSPRSLVAPGSVGIGDKQTGVYPCASPGGWNIIGNSPIRFFDPSKRTPCFAKAGDRVKFYSIAYDRYRQIKHRVVKNEFHVQFEAYYDQSA